MQLVNLLEPLRQVYHRVQRPSRSCTEDPAERLARRNRRMPEELAPTRTPISLSYTPTQDAAVPLLAKLPFEIRRLVYAHALGNHLVHLVDVPHHITHFRCEASSVADQQRSCHPNQLRRSYSDQALPSSFSSHSSSIAVSLLRTNRQIYAEALPLLYASNIFDTDDLSTFTVFANNISPQGLSSIRTLHLNWSPDFPPLEFEVTADPAKAPNDDATYRRFWDIVSGGEMPALREFRLFFATSWFLNDLGAGTVASAPWAQPLQGLRGLEFLEVALVEDAGTREDRREQVDAFAAKLGEAVCCDGARIVTRVLSREDRVRAS